MPEMDQPLDVDELASEAESTPERIRQLAEIGAITPGDDGKFRRGDLVRVRVIAAYEAMGFSVDQMATAIRERAVTLYALDRFYPDPGVRTGRSYAEFVEELGPRGALASRALMAMGLPVPSPSAPTREPEEAALTKLIAAWSAVDEEFTLRAARILGDAMRRVVDGWVGLYAEAISRPIESEYRTIDEIVPRLVTPAVELTQLMPELMGWIFKRHLERALNESNMSRIEGRMEQRGLIPVREEHPPAVAFVDLSDYTRLTAQRGDELGARTAVRLAELADEVVRDHGGRVVKLLGDGVLLRFDTVCAAVEVTAAMMQRMLDDGLPAGHAGIHAGSLIERDGDIYGTTVNVASRIATHAQPGELLASAFAVAECPELDGRFETLGETRLKGIDDPIALSRWLGPR